MNHNYISNNDTIDKCIECGYPAAKHGDSAICDCCDKTGSLFPFGDAKTGKQMLLTRECMEREKAIIEREIADKESERSKAIREHQSPENQEKRLQENNYLISPYNELIKNARKIDEQLHLSSDIFTAKTVPIEELRRTIWADESIPNDKKFFEYVAECKRRIDKLRNVIFDLDKQKIEAYSEQKAWHVAMNDYANKLRAEEREQLRIQDINYDVKMPKPITPKAVKLTQKKAGVKEVRAAVSALADELGQPSTNLGMLELMVNRLMTSKNWELKQAIDNLRLTLKTGMSESSKS